MARIGHNRKKGKNSDRPLFDATKKKAMFFVKVGRVVGRRKVVKLKESEAVFSFQCLDGYRLQSDGRSHYMARIGRKFKQGDLQYKVTDANLANCDEWMFADEMTNCEKVIEDFVVQRKKEMEEAEAEARKKEEQEKMREEERAKKEKEWCERQIARNPELANQWKDWSAENNNEVATASREEMHRKKRADVKEKIFGDHDTETSMLAAPTNAQLQKDAFRLFSDFERKQAAGRKENMTDEDIRRRFERDNTATNYFEIAKGFWKERAKKIRARREREPHVDPEKVAERQPIEGRRPERSGAVEDDNVDVEMVYDEEDRAPLPSRRAARDMIMPNIPITIEEMEMIDLIDDDYVDGQMMRTPERLNTNGTMPIHQQAGPSGISANSTMRFPPMETASIDAQPGPRSCMVEPVSQTPTVTVAINELEPLSLLSLMPTEKIVPMSVSPKKSAQLAGQRKKRTPEIVNLSESAAGEIRSPQKKAKASQSRISLQSFTTLITQQIQSFPKMETAPERTNLAETSDEPNLRPKKVKPPQRPIPTEMNSHQAGPSSTKDVPESSDLDKSVAALVLSINKTETDRLAEVAKRRRNAPIPHMAGTGFDKPPRRLTPEEIKAISQKSALKMETTSTRVNPTDNDTADESRGRPKIAKPSPSANPKVADAILPQAGANRQKERVDQAERIPQLTGDSEMEYTPARRSRSANSRQSHRIPSHSILLLPDRVNSAESAAGDISQPSMSAIPKEPKQAVPSQKMETTPARISPTEMSSQQAGPSGKLETTQARGNHADKVPIPQDETLAKTKPTMIPPMEPAAIFQLPGPRRRMIGTPRRIDPVENTGENGSRLKKANASQMHSPVESTLKAGPSKKMQTAPKTVDLVESILQQAGSSARIEGLLERTSIAKIGNSISSNNLMEKDIALHEAPLNAAISQQPGPSRELQMAPSSSTASETEEQRQEKERIERDERLAAFYDEQCKHPTEKQLEEFAYVTYRNELREEERNSSKTVMSQSDEEIKRSFDEIWARDDSKSQLMSRAQQGWDERAARQIDAREREKAMRAATGECYSSKQITVRCNDSPQLAGPSSAGFERVIAGERAEQRQLHFEQQERAARDEALNYQYLQIPNEQQLKDIANQRYRRETRQEERHQSKTMMSQSDEDIEREFDQQWTTQDAFKIYWLSRAQQEWDKNAAQRRQLEELEKQWRAEADRGECSTSVQRSSPTSQQAGPSGVSERPPSRIAQRRQGEEDKAPCETDEQRRRRLEHEKMVEERREALFDRQLRPPESEKDLEELAFLHFREDLRLEENNSTITDVDIERIFDERWANEDMFKLNWLSRAQQEWDRRAADIRKLREHDKRKQRKRDQAVRGECSTSVQRSMRSTQHAPHPAGPSRSSEMMPSRSAPVEPAMQISLTIKREMIADSCDPGTWENPIELGDTDDEDVEMA